MSDDGVDVYRVQDREGRGPWRPGFSDSWVEDRADLALLIPWTTEFGMGILDHATPGFAVGCGCTSLDALRRWFTPTEYATLRAVGYECVRIAGCRVLASSDIQCVFERRAPLRRRAFPITLYEMQSEPRQ